ncbi:MAG: Zn-ribbon domain-containing OB-fold protein [Burkholderiaceae bacterium]|nr:Zn-ribbon domain-containing OB-fold protein [Burkholderiaceae bacterium]
MQAIFSIDAQGYWDGLQAGQLRVQRCAACGRLRHYPRPLCPACHSFEVEWVALAGHGTVHSWTRPHQSALPGFAEQVPFTLVTVDMAEGVRVLGRLDDADPSALRPGAAVTMTIAPAPSGQLQPVFRLTDRR